MPFTLDQIVPLGRTLDEYSRMFSLTADDLSRRILGCGDGPASFNAEATRRGAEVLSCDPLYQFSAAQISERFSAAFAQVIEQTRLNQDEFVWQSISSIDELARLRASAVRQFLADYATGRAAGRYVTAGLPALPFADHEFDLALCSHLLFLYSEQLTEAFHCEAALELCRVAREVRIFPLLALGSVPSPWVNPVAEALRAAGYMVEIVQVDYEFQRGGNQMMRITRRV